MNASRMCKPGTLQDGQALAETLVIASFVLVPFIIAVPMLAKYQSIRQATEASARTAAFECTVRIEDCHQDAATGGGGRPDPASSLQSGAYFHPFG